MLTFTQYLNEQYTNEQVIENTDMYFLRSDYLNEGIVDLAKTFTSKFKNKIVQFIKSLGPKIDIVDFAKTILKLANGKNLILAGLLAGQILGATSVANAGTIRISNDLPNSAIQKIESMMNRDIDQNQLVKKAIEGSNALETALSIVQKQKAQQQQNDKNAVHNSLIQQQVELFRSSLDALVKG